MRLPRSRSSLVINGVAITPLSPVAGFGGSSHGFIQAEPVAGPAHLRFDGVAQPGLR